MRALVSGCLGQTLKSTADLYVGFDKSHNAQGCFNFCMIEALVS